MSHDKAHQIEDQNKSPPEPPVFSARRLSISPVQFSKKHARLQDTDTDTDTDSLTYSPDKKDKDVSRLMWK